MQDEELTQRAIERRQTLIAFESMNLWSRNSSFKLHVFHKNNEIAGYYSVLHAMSIVSWSGTYGRRLRAGRVPLAGFLAQRDILVNCVLQDSNAALIFRGDDDLAALRPNSLIIDVSCDETMGLIWALPTSFARPTFSVGANVTCYAVDHSPSYLWDSATWEISGALLPYLATVIAGRDA
nr:hypothetical protein [Mycolicibacterium vulneris]